MGRPQAGWRGAGITRRSYSRGLTAAPQRVGASARKPSDSQEPRGGLKPPCIDCAGRQEGAEREAELGTGTIAPPGAREGTRGGRAQLFGEPQSEPAELNRRTGGGEGERGRSYPRLLPQLSQSPPRAPRFPSFPRFCESPRPPCSPLPRFQSN